MSNHDEFIQRQRVTWASGKWDDFSNMLQTLTPVILGHLGDISGKKLLDVGTGSGGTVAIPAALAGADVTGCDITTELFEHARRRAAEAGVDVDWVEGNAQDLPFDDASFDIVTSTFGAMFAPDHKATASELVRVCRPGGTVAMTTWAMQGFVGEMFLLNPKFLPPPPEGVEPPPAWGVEDHVRECFAAAGAEPEIEHRKISFDFESIEYAVGRYENDFGPFVMARRVLEPEGRWGEFMSAFEDVVRKWATETGDGVSIESDYLLITVRP